MIETIDDKNYRRIRELETELASLRAENERLVSFGRKQQDEIETIGYMADAVERLREIGQVTGCDHADDPDGRLALVNCVDAALGNLQSRLADAEEKNKRLVSAIRALRDADHYDHFEVRLSDSELAALNAMFLLAREGEGRKDGE